MLQLWQFRRTIAVVWAVCSAVWLFTPGCTFDEGKLRRPTRDGGAERFEVEGSPPDLQAGKPESAAVELGLTAEIAASDEAGPDLAPTEVAWDAPALADALDSNPVEIGPAKDAAAPPDPTDGGGGVSDGSTPEDFGQATADTPNPSDGGEADSTPVPIDSADLGLEAVPRDADKADGPDGTDNPDGNIVGNLALSATAYRWSGNTASTSNANRVAEPRLNDDSTAADFNLAGSGWDPVDSAWEAAGVVLTRDATITSVVFVHGASSRQPNGTSMFSSDGYFDANFHLQISTDGIVWSDAMAWSLSPPYPYNETAADGRYVFTGVATRVRGVRVTGQVRLASSVDVSWNATAREIQVLGTP